MKTIFVLLLVLLTSCAAKRQDSQSFSGVLPTLEEVRSCRITCQHPLGGSFEHGSCTGTMQCCDGSWDKNRGSCGTCTCFDVSGKQGCATQDCSGYKSSLAVVPEFLRNRMVGTTWRKGCPVPLDDLLMLKFRHWNYEGRLAEGTLIVHKEYGEKLAKVMEKLFDVGFPIEKAVPASEYGGIDERTMQDNNTSAFNCRGIEGSSGWSQHAYGKAIDINPKVNPFVKGNQVLPANGTDYVNRSRTSKGMIFANDPVVKAFKDIGWGWGGTWRSLKDYQHFSWNHR